MKNIKKIISLLLSTIMCFSITACKDPNVSSGTDDSSSSSSSGFNNTGDPVIPSKVFDGDEEHMNIPGTLHKVTVKESNRTFVTNKNTAYKIVSNGITEANIAAGYISQMVKKATGVALEIITAEEATWSPEAKYIVIDVDSLFNEAGLTMPQDDLGPSGYYIKSVGNSVFISVNAVNAYQWAALSFLDHVVGYD